MKGSYMKLCETLERSFLLIEWRLQKTATFWPGESAGRTLYAGLWPALLRFV